MRSILRRLARRHTTAVAYLALFAALGGSAYAAVTVTGTNIKDGTITGSDVKNRSLGTKKLSTKAIRSLTNQHGPAGPRGEQGPVGPTGPKGPKGDTGAAGATNVVIRRAPLTTINPDGNSNSVATCNAGEVPIAGGAEVRNGDIDDMVVWGSIPEDLDLDNVAEGWRVRVRNDDANNDNLGTIQFRAEVMCASP